MPIEILPHDPLVRHHAWSRDPARDRAVRLAEDGVTERPTLEECIAGVFLIPKLDSVSNAAKHENKGESMSDEWRKMPVGETVLAGDEYADPYGVWRPIQEWMIGTILTPNHGEYRRSVPPSQIPPAPQSRPAETRQSKSGEMRTERVVEDGMITKRITLQVTHHKDVQAGGLAVYVSNFLCLRGGSVRVVPDAEIQPMKVLNVGEQWSEWCKLNEDRDSWRRTAEKLQEEINAAMVHLPACCGSLADAASALQAERDALAARVAHVESQWCLSREACYERAAERDKAEARVAELENENGNLGMAAEMNFEEWEKAKARVGELAESAGSGAAERLHRETWLRLERDELIIQRDKLISRVAELEAERDRRLAIAVSSTQFAPAAEPVANSSADPNGSPQPRGWLTSEERGALEHAHQLLAGRASDLKSDTHAFSATGSFVCEESDRIVTSLLARNSPPVVVLPEPWREAAGDVVSVDDVRAALAAAGVECE
jgi:hypothetical protein